MRGSRWHVLRPFCVLGGHYEGGAAGAVTIAMPVSRLPTGHEQNPRRTPLTVPTRWVM
jgi:hypothetical protein